ncbi:exonuclease domain-containing protein [Ferrimonas senticii]|uniref:exonuclease domain-containing protein n=1 Tax=Ferrimonas senticii TaxID=394566 RepID=UPI0003FD742C|nr:exonuclease domain-containing protein [Ferrimonas senticii]
MSLKASLGQLRQWLQPQPLLQLQQQRQQLLDRRDLPPQLLALLQSPLPAPTTALTELPLLALDLETSGLDANCDHILSLGYLPLNQRRWCLNKAQLQHVAAADKVCADSAVINHITPEMLSHAQPLRQCLLALFEQMIGRAVVVHGRCIEQQFIEHWLWQHYRIKQLPILWFDTLHIEKARQLDPERQLNGDFSLAAVRSDYQLPSYPSHHPTTDALACGELLLAQWHKLYGQSRPTLGQFCRSNYYQL